MEEARLRELAHQLLSELDTVIPDAQECRRAQRDIEAGLARPEGEGRRPLIKALSVRRETREWVAAHEPQTDESDRMVPGLLGQVTEAALGIHVVCPKCDFDRYLESPDEDPGHCPNDGSRLVAAED